MTPTAACASLLLEHITDHAIYAIDTQGKILSWTAGAENVKGYGADEVLGRHFSIFFTPEDRESAEPDRELLAAAANGRLALEGWRIRKNGSRFWADVTVAPMRDERGEVCSFVKVTRDLTERHERQEQRVQVARAEEVLRLHNEFLSRARSGVETTLVTLRVHLRSLIGTVESRGDDEMSAKLQMLDWGIDRMVRSIEQFVSAAETTSARFNEELASIRVGPPER